LGPWLADDLSKVPEIHFQEPLRLTQPKDAKAGAKEIQELALKTAYQIAKAHVLNRHKTDGFLAFLIRERGDLHGLPFVMGDDSRGTPARSAAFTSAVVRVRLAKLIKTGGADAAEVKLADAQEAQQFWDAYRARLAEEEKGEPPSDVAAHLPS